MPFTNNLDQALLEYLLISGNWPTLYIAVSTTTPTQTAGAWNFTEPSGNGYARQAVASGAGSWEADPTQPGSGYSYVNVNAITFATASGTGWGTLTYGGGFDALTGGNLLFYGPLAPEQSINVGDTLVINAQQLVVTND